MAINTTSIGVTTAIPTYTSVDDNAITFMSLCNHGGATLTLDINIVPNGDAVGIGNLFIKDLEILAGDTYVVYQAGEKFILSNGDVVSVTSSVGAVTVITSSVQV